MSFEFLVLRLVHVLGAIFWVGSGMFTGLFLMPALAKLGANAGQVMAGLQQRRLFVVLPTVAVLTIASGLRLMWLTSGGFSPAYFATPRGGTFGVSGLAAILAFLAALLIARPAAVRAGKVADEISRAADDDSRLRLQARHRRLQQLSGVASRITVGLLLFGAAGMAIARYVG